MLKINLISSIYKGIYDCTIRHDCSGLFLICMTCMYGEMFPGHDSFVLLQGHAYLWFFTANKPNPVRMYGIISLRHRGSACVFLKSSL